MVERHGRKSKGKPRKKPLPPAKQQDLIGIAAVKRTHEYLEMVNEYLKKLDALIRVEGQKKKQ